MSPVGEVRVDVLGRALDDLALGGDDVLGAQVLGHGEGVARGLRVHDELHEPRAVAQVDEDEPAVVAAAVDPARDADLGRRSARRSGRRPRRRGRCWVSERGSSGVASLDDACDGGRGGLHVLLLAGVHVAQLRAVRAHDGNVAGPGAVCLLELALQRAPGELLLDGEPRGPRLGGQREGLDPAVLVGDEEIGDRRAAPAALRRPAASAPGPRPSPCPGSAGRRAARSARRSARRPRRRTARPARRR